MYTCDDFTCPYYKDGICTLENPQDECENFYMEEDFDDEDYEEED